MRETSSQDRASDPFILLSNAFPLIIIQMLIKSKLYEKDSCDITAKAIDLGYKNPEYRVASAFEDILARLNIGCFGSTAVRLVLPQLLAATNQARQINVRTCKR